MQAKPHCAVLAGCLFVDAPQELGANTVTASVLLPGQQWEMHLYNLEGWYPSFVAWAITLAVIGCTMLSIFVALLVVRQVGVFKHGSLPGKGGRWGSTATQLAACRAVQAIANGRPPASRLR